MRHVGAHSCMTFLEGRWSGEEFRWCYGQSGCTIMSGLLGEGCFGRIHS